jgi:hypothetical protein
MRRRPFGLISLHRLALRWSMFGCWSIRGDQTFGSQAVQVAPTLAQLVPLA